MKNFTYKECKSNAPTTGINIPEGKFCSNNCCDCIYYNTRDTDSTGRVL